MAQLQYSKVIEDVAKCRACAIGRKSMVFVVRLIEYGYDERSPQINFGKIQSAVIPVDARRLEGRIWAKTLEKKGSEELARPVWGHSLAVVNDGSNCRARWKYLRAADELPSASSMTPMPMCARAY